MKKKNLLIFIQIFALIGILLAGMLTVAKYSDTVAYLCGEDSSNSCNTVQNSQYSYLISAETSDGSQIKVPLTLAGILFYVAIYFMAHNWRVSLTKGGVSSKFRTWFVILGVLGALFSLAFTLIQAFLIEAFCTYCLISALDTFILLGFILYLVFGFNHKSPSKLSEESSLKEEIQVEEAPKKKTSKKASKKKSSKKTTKKTSKKTTKKVAKK